MQMLCQGLSKHECASCSCSGLQELGGCSGESRVPWRPCPWLMLGLQPSWPPEAYNSSHQGVVAAVFGTAWEGSQEAVPVKSYLEDIHQEPTRLTGTCNTEGLKPQRSNADMAPVPDFSVRKDAA